MPHVTVQLVSGRTEAQKAKIAEEVTKAIMETANCGADAVSVAIHDVAKDAWTEEVYKPDILGDVDRLYKKPGYNPL